MLQDY